jgi:3-dehydroquinate synthase class II
VAARATSIILGRNLWPFEALRLVGIQEIFDLSDLGVFSTLLERHDPDVLVDVNLSALHFAGRLALMVAIVSKIEKMGSGDECEIDESTNLKRDLSWLLNDIQHFDLRGCH